MVDTSSSQVYNPATGPNQKTLRDRLTGWDNKDNPRAPLTDRQRDAFIELTTQSTNRRLPSELPVDDVVGSSVVPTSTSGSGSAVLSGKDDDLWTKYLSSATASDTIETAQQFFNWFGETEAAMMQDNQNPQWEFLENIRGYTNECDAVIEEIEQCLEHLTVLKTDYVRVATKTTSLHEACENLLEDQTRLVNAAETINSRLAYFNELDRISSKLGSPTFSVTSESFLPMLTQLDECIDYLNKHPEYQESSVFLTKYKQCLWRALSLLRTHIFNILQLATQQALPTKDTTFVADDAFTLFYGKFRTNAPRVKSFIEQIEQRLNKSTEYEQILSSCHQFYFQQRLSLLSPSVSSAVSELATRHARDHCSLVRSGCAFMIHVCEDEHKLFGHFFSKPTPQLDHTLESLCTVLYDVLRPLIIHVNHLETLAELCSILKLEMMEEHIQNNSIQLAAFDVVCAQMLQDVQERLVYRTHVFIRQEILNYKPGGGDLAYPDKLEMMQSIAEKINKERLESRGSVDQPQGGRRFLQHSRHGSSSSIQSANSLEVAEISATALEAEQRIAELAQSSTTDEPAQLIPTASDGAIPAFSTVPLESTSNMPMSPADMHGMWYPTVRRTLVCLSKLYRCIDRASFQGLSQETLSMCVQSLIKASDSITKNKSTMDGQLFLIKHLLILREQIAPFHIDFAVKEMALDFSKLKNAAVELINARSRLFAFNSNNAVLQFLLEGTPTVMETYIDSRKEVDMQLKRTCEDFIKDVTNQFTGALRDFLAKASVIVQMRTAEGAARVSLRAQPFAVAEKVRDLVATAYRNLKQRKPAIQSSMALYLANRDTEYILFKPLKANVQETFHQLHTLLTDQYTEEDRQIIAAPTLEQIALLLTSTTSSKQSSSIVVPQNSH